MKGTVLGTWDILVIKEMTVTARIYTQYWYRSSYLLHFCIPKQN